MHRIVIFQFSPQNRSVGQNVDYIVEKLSKVNFALVALPEFFLSSYYEYDFLSWQDIGRVLKPLADLSTENNLIISGSLPISDGGRNFNRGIIIENGNIFYKDKIELFGLEQDIFEPGRQSSLRFASMKICMQVCMDIGNPTHAWHEVRKSKANIIINPATASLPFLHTINKARSMENQVQSIFANRCGEDVNGIKYMGKSAIFYPDGGEIILGVDEEFRSIEPSDRPKFTCG